MDPCLVYHLPPRRPCGRGSGQRRHPLDAAALAGRLLLGPRRGPRGLRLPAAHEVTYAKAQHSVSDASVLLAFWKFWQAICCDLF